MFLDYPSVSYEYGRGDYLTHWLIGVNHCILYNFWFGGTDSLVTRMGLTTGRMRSGFSPSYLPVLVTACRIREFSGHYFPALELNKEIYRIDIRIQFESGKIWTRKTMHLDNFCAVSVRLNPLSYIPKLSASTLLRILLCLWTSRIYLTRLSRHYLLKVDHGNSRTS